MPSTTRLYLTRSRSSNRWSRLFIKVRAIIAAVDLGVVFFDYTYISMRDIYLTRLPWIAQQYDPIKAIEPYRETEQYISLVAALKKFGPQGGERDQFLAQLRDRSTEMIVENPFEAANKSGTLEKIKNRMRSHLPNENDSSKQAFQEFWSADHLTPQNWEKELAFFDKEIRPLIASNYYRPIAENNLPVDYFWRIDLIFIGIFGLELLLRTLYLSRRNDLSWRDAILWRWYDVLLLFPFWRLLRVIPVALRLHQARLIDLSRAQILMNRFLAENIAGEVTELAIIQGVTVAQTSIRQGIIRDWLTTTVQPNVEINDVNEIEALINQVLALTVRRVLPTIQPDLEAILCHAITEALTGLPLYREFKTLPGVGQLPAEIASQIIHQVTNAAYGGLNQALSDEEGRVLFSHLTEQFTLSLREELQDRQTLDSIQVLLLDFLEETKLTIVKRLETEDIDQTIVQAQQLRQVGSEKNKLPTIKVVRPYS
ncbi:MAG: hypothetical protein WA902_24160 [Thermosynechococcaceae cyanobacterium]